MQAGGQDVIDLARSTRVEHPLQHRLQRQVGSQVEGVVQLQHCFCCQAWVQLAVEAAAAVAQGQHVEGAAGHQPLAQPAAGQKQGHGVGVSAHSSVDTEPEAVVEAQRQGGRQGDRAVEGPIGVAQAAAGQIAPAQLNLGGRKPAGDGLTLAPDRCRQGAGSGQLVEGPLQKVQAALA